MIKLPRKLITLFFLLLGYTYAFAVPKDNLENLTTENATKPTKKITYKKGKDMSFESQVVEGNVYRPELSVVTGDTELGGTGVLRLRTELNDHILLDMGGNSL